MYFVTICSFRRRSIFGQIRGNEAILSRIGEIIRTCWIEVPQHFPSVKIETYVVMPNHLHGILTIDSNWRGENCRDNTVAATESFGRPTHRSIPTIVRSFKAAASKRSRESGLVGGESIWQRGYYEHVIRNSAEYVEVTNYILLNPARWSVDEDNLDRESGTDKP